LTFSRMLANVELRFILVISIDFFVKNKNNPEKGQDYLWH